MEKFGFLYSGQEGLDMAVIEGEDVFKALGIFARKHEGAELIRICEGAAIVQWQAFVLGLDSGA
ncbi:MAG: hypothetical protein U1B94_01415 [candidate division NC10 bacterium]|nr:hypothetical protein [candidate division NC10 bacterium]